MLEANKVVMTRDIYNRMYKLNIEVVHPKEGTKALIAMSTTYFDVPTPIKSVD